MKRQPTAAPALTTPKHKADSPPNTVANKGADELALLRQIIAESKCFQRPASENGIRSDVGLNDLP